MKHETEKDVAGEQQQQLRRRQIATEVGHRKNETHKQQANNSKTIRSVMITSQMTMTKLNLIDVGQVGWPDTEQ